MDSASQIAHLSILHRYDELQRWSQILDRHWTNFFGHCKGFRIRINYHCRGLSHHLLVIMPLRRGSEHFFYYFDTVGMNL